MSDRKNDKKFRDQTVIQIINKCIGLKEPEKKRSNEILTKVCVPAWPPSRIHQIYHLN